MKITARLLIVTLLAMLIFPELRNPVVFAIFAVLWVRVKWLSRNAYTRKLIRKEMKQQGLID